MIFDAEREAIRGFGVLGDSRNYAKLQVLAGEFGNDFHAISWNSLEYP